MVYKVLAADPRLQEPGFVPHLSYSNTTTAKGVTKLIANYATAKGHTTV